MSLGTMVYHTFYIIVLKMDKLGKSTLHNKSCNMHWLCVMVAYSFIISVNTMRYQLFMSLGTMVYHTFYEFYIIVLKMAKLGKTCCVINYIICIGCAWWWPTPSSFWWTQWDYKHKKSWGSKVRCVLNRKYDELSLN